MLRKPSNPTTTKIRPSLLRSAAATLAIAFCAALTVLAQSPGQEKSEGYPLPPTTGEPLTIKPVDMEDVDCVIAKWDASASRPTLTVICPPESVFAPLRVLIKLSRTKPNFASADPAKIPFRVGALTKIRTNKDAAQIRLLADGAHGVQAEWVPFDAVGDLALLIGHPKNNPPKKARSTTEATSGFPPPSHPSYPPHLY